MTKKTTLMIDDGLYDALRKKALAQGRSISSTVSEALRRYVNNSEPTRSAPVELPVVDMGALLVPEELFESSSRLEEYIDKLEQKQEPRAS